MRCITNEGMGRWLRSAMVCVLVSACGGGSTEQLIASAKANLQKQEAGAAIIDLKNALQKTPDSAEARDLLGQALLDNSEFVAAAVELGKAIDLGSTEIKALPRLARALNASGQFRKLTDRYATTLMTDADATAELKAELVTAFAAQGNRAAAERELRLALRASPDNLATRLAQSRMAAAAGDADGAMALIESALRTAPSSEDALLLKAELLAGAKSDLAGALRTYREALGIHPRSIAARAGIVTLLLQNREMDAATQALVDLKKAAPRAPQIRWFDAQLALQKGDSKEAGKLAQQMMSANASDVRVLYLAGVADYQAGALVSAEHWLKKALQTEPDNRTVRKTLAQTQLRLGQAARALASIQPVIEKNAADGQALAITAQAHLLAGDAAKAQDYFARAAAADPADVKNRTALALTQSVLGGGAAIGNLQDIAAQSSGSFANLGLVHVLMRRGDFDAALAAIARLETKQPDQAMTAHLRGLVLLAKQDSLKARSSFERALSIDPKFVLSAARLAALDLNDNQPEAATKRLAAVLAADPKNAQALLSMAELKALTGGSKKEVADLLKSAVATDPSDAAPRLKLIEHHLRGGDVRSALEAAQAGMAAQPDNPQIIEAFGTAQLAAGDLNQATASFNKLAGLQPDSPTPHLRLAEVYAASKNNEAAVLSLKRALALAPHSWLIQHKLVLRLLAAGQQAQALEMARVAKKQSPASPMGDVFEGDVEASRKNRPAAAAAYAAAQAKGPSTEVAMKLHATLLEAGRGPEAEKVAAAWLQSGPPDAVFLSYLGEVALLAKDYPTAEARYLDVLRLAPGHAVALNNVAWLLVKQKKPGALPYAEKANRLQPDAPPFMDTLAGALEAESQLDKAIAVLRKAVDLQPETGTFRLHLAQLYLRGGDKPAARAELDRLSKLGSQFAQQDEVSRLIKTL